MRVNEPIAFYCFLGSPKTVDSIFQELFQLLNVMFLSAYALDALHHRLHLEFYLFIKIDQTFLPGEVENFQICK